MPLGAGNAYRINLRGERMEGLAQGRRRPGERGGPGLQALTWRAVWPLAGGPCRSRIPSRGLLRGWQLGRVEGSLVDYLKMGSIWLMRGRGLGCG
jgi:hypothetical protein